LTNPSIRDCIRTSIDSRLHLNIKSKFLRLAFAGSALSCTILYCTSMYCKCLPRYSFCVSRLHKSLLYSHFAVYRIHFRSARTSVLYILLYIADTRLSRYSFRVCLFRYSFCVLRLHKSLLYRHFAVYWIHFRHARKLRLHSFPNTVLRVWKLSKIDSRVSRLHNFAINRQFAVYRIHFRLARQSVLYI
jgi:hypothetical protein